jgi:hypothetical protein
MLRPEGATAFKKCCWSEGTSLVVFMNTAIFVVVCHNLPMDAREVILKTDSCEEKVRGMSTQE